MRVEAGGAERGPAWHATLGAMAVLALALAAGVPSLFVRDLWDGDEIRLTEGAREMVVLGNWRAPRLNGRAVWGRPPGAYWATALLWEAGTGLRSARVLSALSVTGLLIACYLAVASRAGAGAGLLAAGIALTTATGMWHVRTGGATPMLAFFMTVAVLAGYRALHAGGPRALGWWLVSYAAMGLGVVTGGSLGLLLPAVTLLAYGAFSRAPRRRWMHLHLLGFMVVWVASGLWLVGKPFDIHEALAAVAADLDGLLDTLREGEILKSALRAVFALFPWVLVLPAALAGGLPGADGAGGKPRLLAAVWLAAAAVPVLLSGEADYAYALAATPPLAILCALAFQDGGGEPRRAVKWATGTALVAAALPTAGGLLLGILHLAGLSHLLTGQSYVCPVTMQPYSPWALAAALPFVIAALVLLARALIRRPPTGSGRAVALVSAVMLIGLAGDVFLTPVINAYVSARPFAEAVAGEIGDEGQLHTFRTDYDGVYNLYTGRTRIPVLQSTDELRTALAREGAYVICDEKRLKKAGLLDEREDTVVAGGNVGGRYMMLLRGRPQ